MARSVNLSENGQLTDAKGFPVPASALDLDDAFVSRIASAVVDELHRREEIEGYG